MKQRWAIDKYEEAVLVDVLVIWKIGWGLLYKKMLLLHGTALFTAALVSTRAVWTNLIHRYFLNWIWVFIFVIFDAFHFFTTATQRYVGVKNCATLRLGLKLGLSSKIAQHLIDFLIGFSLRALTERLLLRWHKKRFVDLRSIVINLALTRVLLVSFNKYVILLIFIKNWFLLLLVLKNDVVTLSKAAYSIFKRALTHRSRIVEAYSWNSLFWSKGLTKKSSEIFIYKVLVILLLRCIYRI